MSGFRTGTLVEFAQLSKIADVYRTSCEAFLFSFGFSFHESSLLLVSFMKTLDATSSAFQRLLAHFFVSNSYLSHPAVSWYKPVKFNATRVARLLSIQYCYMASICFDDLFNLIGSTKVSFLFFYVDAKFKPVKTTFFWQALGIHR